MQADLEELVSLSEMGAEIKSGFLKLGPLVVLDMISKKIQCSDCFESRCSSAIIAELGR